MDLLKRRGFRPEVFTAEDQEWASWLFRCEGKATARISGARSVTINPTGHSLKKYRNEYVSIAYFANKELLRWRNIGRVLWAAFQPAGGFRLRSRASDLLLFFRLFACRFAMPRARSRYF
jgi:hypothetical protein